MGNRYTCKQSFEEWCLENNRQDLLDRWDYSKNELPPSQMPFGTKRRAYFKCPNGIHGSESKSLAMITDKPNHMVECHECGGKNRREDLSGRKFGELDVLSFDEKKSRESGLSYWMCRCSCGNIISALASKLKSGNKRTCGGKTSHLSRTDFDFTSDDPAEIKRLRRSGLYQQYRNTVIEKDHGRCIVCGDIQNIEVHHLYPFATHISDRFDVNNGVCVCAKHHSNTIKGSFHNIYGMRGNTPEQFEHYVNMKRQELGIKEPFDVYAYMNPYDADDMEIDDSMLDFEFFE